MPSLDKASIKRLDLTSAAKSVTTVPLDHLPMLISDRCLAGDLKKLVEAAGANLESDQPVLVETITMPKRGFSPRPLVLLGATQRVAYVALVDLLSKSLPPPSRGQGKWPAFESYGLPGTTPSATYIVSLDIAACYEYIDHEKLMAELVLHSADVTISEAVKNLLTKALPQGAGLPQMMAPSDLLADAYLSSIERELVRLGFSNQRYADDFRVLTDSWETATGIIETAAGICRRLGLVLQPEKTDIRLATTIDERRKRRDEFVEERFAKRRDDDSTWEWLFSNDYEDSESTDGEENDEMSPEEIDAAYMALLVEWKEGGATADGDSIAFGLVGRALAALRDAAERVPDDVLKQIVFKDATKLEQVLRYVSARSELAANWKTIRALLEMHRQSPWAKIWLLSTIDKLDGSDNSVDVQAVLTWAKTQLADPHEHVRAEAAWTMSGKDDIKGDLMGLFGRASRLTRPGIAAACGRVGTLTKEEISAVRGEGPLAAAAFDWASTP